MATKNSAPDDSDSTRTDSTQGGQLVERMFSGFAHSSDLLREATPRSAPEPLRALRQSKTRPGATYRLQSLTPVLQVRSDSPATDVMTDLTRVAAITVPPGASVDDAHQAMIAHGVRALFVVDEARNLLGIITSTDVLGEEPIRVAQQRGVRHAEVAVREVMTSLDALEAIDLQDVLAARVGDVVETLKQSGRQHALVIESRSADTVALTVRGIFSLTQIARQLGLTPEVRHDVARTFAEIEAAIGA
ncbi:MAG: CBS domain-containing protein [Casimicrobiaceae bacterium]